MSSFLSVKFKKAFFSLIHPRCWNALCLGLFPAIEHCPVLARLDCDVILDVGATRGQFSLMSRIVMPAIPIFAFEPIPTEAEIFRKALLGEYVQLHQVALGDKAGEAELHLSRSPDSSSLLPIGEAQTRLFPATGEIGTLKVPVKRLDDFKPEWEKYSRILLKIDVQGFELSVLRGAVETLKNCVYIYVECSEVNLYVGQSLYRDVADFLNHEGFDLHSRHNEIIAGDELLQADYLFTRKQLVPIGNSKKHFEA